jgi:predicted DNA-binding transcriptional regulator YafY
MQTITLTEDQAQSILSALVALEHRTKGIIDTEHYKAIVKLCQTLEAPQFYTEYFARKAIS